MNTKRVLSTAGAFLLLMCVCPAVSAEDTGNGVSRLRYRVEAEPGGEYSHRKWFFVIPVKLKPQMAIWVEDGQGRHVRTLYVTGKTAGNSWRGGAEERPEALPIFTHRRKDGTTDAVSGATPKADKREQLSWEVTLDGQRDYYLCAEVNSSFDYNKAYPKGESGVNGQPSLFYRGRIPAGGIDHPRTLQPAGHGAVDGGSGEVFRSLRGMEEALNIVERITVSPVPAGRQVTR